MRDLRFQAVHRGGPLSLAKHRLLALWAADCAEHVHPLFLSQYPEDKRLLNAIEIARAWARGDSSVGDARQASLAAHAAAREADKDAARYAARAAGHAVATAHMADHAPRAAVYAIKAVKAASAKQLEAVAVRQAYSSQQKQLPEELQALLMSTFEQKDSFLEL